MATTPDIQIPINEVELPLIAEFPTGIDAEGLAVAEVAGVVDVGDGAAPEAVAPKADSISPSGTPPSTNEAPHVFCADCLLASEMAEG